MHIFAVFVLQPNLATAPVDSICWPAWALHTFPGTVCPPHTHTLTHHHLLCSNRDAVFCESHIAPLLDELKYNINLQLHYIGDKQVGATGAPASSGSSSSTGTTALVSQSGDQLADVTGLSATW